MAYIQPYFRPTENPQAPWFVNVWNSFMKVRTQENFRAMDKFLKAQDTDYLDAQIKTSQENLAKLYDLRTRLAEKDMEFAQKTFSDLLEARNKAMESDRLRDKDLTDAQVTIITSGIKNSGPMLTKHDQRRQFAESALRRNPDNIIQRTSLIMQGDGDGAIFRSIDANERESKLRELVIDPAIEAVYGSNMNSQKLITENPATYNMFVSLLMREVEENRRANADERFAANVTRVSTRVSDSAHDKAYVKNILTLSDAVGVNIRRPSSVRKRTFTFTDDNGNTVTRFYNPIGIPGLGGANELKSNEVTFRSDNGDPETFWASYFDDDGNAAEFNITNPSVMKGIRSGKAFKTSGGVNKYGGEKSSKRFNEAAYALSPLGREAQGQIQRDMLAKLPMHKRVGRLKKEIAAHKRKFANDPGRKVKFDGEMVDRVDLRNMLKDTNGRLYGRSNNALKDKALVDFLRSVSPELDDALRTKGQAPKRHKLQNQLSIDIADLKENIQNLNVKKMMAQRRIAEGNLYAPFKRNFLLENPFKVKSEGAMRAEKRFKAVEQVAFKPEAGDEIPSLPGVVYNQAYKTGSGFAVGINKDKGTFIYDDLQKEYTFVDAKNDPSEYKAIMTTLSKQSKNPILKPIFELEKLSKEAQQ